MTAPFQFQWEWLDTPGASVRTHGLTWGRFAIACGDRCATQVSDVRSRSTRDGIYLPLMPLAEWLVANWWFLAEELAPSLDRALSLRSAPPQHRRWFQRHNLLAAREGYPLPDLTLVRDDEDSIALTQTEDDRVYGNAPVRFINRFVATAPTATFRAECGHLVTAVLERLERCDDADAAALRALWQARCSPDDEGQVLLRRAAAMGLDGEDASEVDDVLAEVLLNDVATLPVELRHEVLEASAAAGVLRQRVGAICVARGQRRSPTHNGALRAARAATEEPSTPSEQAYQVGWRLAMRFRRDVLRLEDAVVGAALDRAFTASALLSELVLATDPADRGLVGWVDAGDDDVATCALQWDVARSRSMRFVRARALGMALQGRRERLVTISTSRSQRTARAFAAELLAPKEAIRAMLRDDVVDDDELAVIASRLDVSPTLVRRQVENHQLAAVVGD